MNPTKQALIIFFLASALALSGAASGAEIYGIGSSEQGSATHRMVTAVAKELTLGTDYQFRAQPFGGTFLTLNPLNQGEIEFSVGNAIEIADAYHGRGLSSSNQIANLRLVGALYPFRVSFLVNADSEIEHYEQLLGNRLPVEYTAQPTVGLIVDRILKAASVNEKNSEFIPITSVVQSSEYFMTGRLDAIFTVIGGGANKRVEASHGDISCVSIDPGSTMVEKLKKDLPVRVEKVEPAPGLVCVDRPINVLTYDYFLYSNKDVPASVVYDLLVTLGKSKEKLAAAIPAFRRFNPSDMKKDIGVPYHAGAIRYFEERGE